jgi:RND family efflux transporter MFP subunit
VEVTDIKKGVINQSQEFIGTLSFNKISNVSSEIAGSIDRVNFDLGDFVKKNQVLAVIDTKVLNSQLNALKSNLKEIEADFENSKRELERFKKLHKSKSVTEQEYDNRFFAVEKIKAKLSSIEANIEEIKIKIDKSSIKAPFDGVVTEKSIEVGEWAKEGDLIANIVNPSVVDAMFNIPMELFNSINRGDSVKLDIGSNSYDSKVHSKILAGDRLTRTFPLKVQIKIDKAEIFSQMEAKLQVAIQKPIEMFLVPKDAVIKRFNQNVIFTVKDGVANMVPVEIKGFDGSYVGILSPMLTLDSSVVVKGNERVFPNQPVTIKK